MILMTYYLPTSAVSPLITEGGPTWSPRAIGALAWGGWCHVRCVAGVSDTPLPPNTAQSAALLPVYWTSLPCFQYDTPICLRQRFSQPRLQRILNTEKLESSDLRVILHFFILHFLLLLKMNLKDNFQWWGGPPTWSTWNLYYVIVGLVNLVLYKLLNASLTMV